MFVAASSYQFRDNMNKLSSKDTYMLILGRRDADAWEEWLRRLNIMYNVTVLLDERAINHYVLHRVEIDGVDLETGKGLLPLRQRCIIFEVENRNVQPSAKV